MDNLKPSTPVFRLGKKILALERREWKGKPQIGWAEVTPDLDAQTLALRGWSPIFRGIRISGNPAEFEQLLTDTLVLLRASTDGGPVQGTRDA